MKKILVTASRYSTLCKSAKKLLEDNGFQIDENSTGNRYTADELSKLVPAYDAAIVGMDPWNKEVIAKADRMKIIAKFGVGYDNIDVEAAKKKGITVTYAAGQNAVSVAELAFSLLMSVVKNLSKFNTHVKKGIWDRELQYELYGKTIGLYGFGNIAQKFAEMLAGFHVNILAYDPYFNKERADERNVIYADVDTLLTHSDVISLHIPGFREHSHIINESALSMMKQNSILINTARVNRIDLTALQKALDEQHLLGAGLDCFEIEPITDPLPLFRHERVVCTPHCGGKTCEAYERISLSTAHNILDIFQGKTPENKL